MSNLKSSLLTPIISLLLFFLLLGLFLKLVGPIPISMNSVVTNKADLFTVQGEGRASAVPDIAKVNLGITADASTVKEAQNQANRIMNKITADLKQLGVEEKDLETTNYSVNPTYDYSAGRQRITGYNVNINLQATVRDLDKVNSVIDTATAGGANLVGGLNFTLNEERLKELQDMAREQAIKEAKDKAESTATIADIRLGRIVNVQEIFNTPNDIRPMLQKIDGAGGGGQPTEIQAGEQEIKISVILSYEIQ